MVTHGRASSPERCAGGVPTAYRRRMRVNPAGVNGSRLLVSTP
ncbi:hypothetical protein ACFQHO_25475 [Actinomadura yumaensis]